MMLVALFLSVLETAAAPSADGEAIDRAASPSPRAAPEGPPLRAIRFKLADATPHEIDQLERYLKDEIGTPADLLHIEKRIVMLRRYRRASCALEEDVAVCEVFRNKIVREVRVEGLPLAILEADLRKRVFLRPGEPLETTRLQRQRQRLLDFFEREGFVGADVRLLTPKANERGEHDVVISVRGGNFVKVRKVDIASWGPLSQRELREAFGAMCLTSEGFLDGVSTGHFASCFNKRRLQATVDRFTQQLKGDGYPEADIRVQPAFVDPTRTDDLDCAISLEEAERARARGLAPPPQCVDLTVSVRSGPRVTARFHAAPGERPLVETPPLIGGTLVWLRESLLEPLSRVLQLWAGEPPALAADTELVELRFQEALSFGASGAVDEIELEVTQAAAEEYLAKRGRLVPRVHVEARTYPGERVFDFFAEPSPIATVRRVIFRGYKEISLEELEEAGITTAPRSATNAGTVSFAQLTSDAETLRAFYEERGFREANVSVRAVLMADSGSVDVVFTIEEGERFQVASLLLEGGDPALTAELVQVLAHCQGGAATRKKRKPETPEDCKGAPLRPDELEADEQRVRTLYASHGYPNVDVRVETSFAAEGVLLRITVARPAGAEGASSGPAAMSIPSVQRVALGEVFLEGNRLTQREVLLREANLAQKNGEPLDPVALGKGISRLRRTGLYQSVQLEYLGLDGSSDRAHVRLSVDERPAFTADTSIGFSSEQLLSLRAEARHKNLFGSMLDASVLFDFGLFIGRFSQARALVRWPRIFGSDISATFTPINVTFSDDPAGSRLTVPSTTAGQTATAWWLVPDDRRRQFSVGGSLVLDWRARDIDPAIDEKLSVGLGLDVRNDWLDPVSRYVPPFSQLAFEKWDGLTLLFEVAQPAPTAAITPRIQFNSLDNPFDPHQGVATELFLRGSIEPFAPVNYLVVGTQFRAYATFFERWTIAGGLRTRTGFSTQVDPNESEEAAACRADSCEWAAMQNDLFRLGGERSVRGVLEDSIGVPNSRQYDTQLRLTTPELATRAGLYGAVANIEVRYTLLRQFLIGDLRPAVFCDFGISTDDFEIEGFPFSANQDRYAWSCGAGLRYVLPVGPLTLDIAYSPLREIGPRPYFFLGYVF